MHRARLRKLRLPALPPEAAAWLVLVALACGCAWAKETFGDPDHPAVCSSACDGECFRGQCVSSGNTGSENQHMPSLAPRLHDAGPP